MNQVTVEVIYVSLNCLQVDICLQWDRVDHLKMPCCSQEICHIRVKITITRANCKYIEVCLSSDV
jgi:hypothetical protein